MSEADVSNCR